MLSSFIRSGLRSSPAILRSVLGTNSVLNHRRSYTSASVDASSHPFRFLPNLGISQVNAGNYDGTWKKGQGEIYKSHAPATQQPIADIHFSTVEDYHSIVKSMNEAKAEWASLPMPRRGEIVRLIGEKLRKKKNDLGALISLEMGKILSEGRGEVQEAIDICDYAVGLSRTISGSVLPSERADHFMMERWNPLAGHVGIITAFNFPCAVYFWNAAISLVCGNTNLWKGAESTSLVSIACMKIVDEVFRENKLNGAVASLISGRGSVVGESIIQDPSFELVSFTGSTKIGRHVNEVTAKRFGKKILELGGNNAMIIMNDADLSLALRAVLFSAVGTAGQRCTTARRLYIQEGVYQNFVSSLTKAYKSVKIGDPLDKETLCGPLHTRAAVQQFNEGVKRAIEEGGKVLVGGNDLSKQFKGGNFVEPTIIEMKNRSAHCIKEELFVPILYVMKAKDLKEAIHFNNNVPQGLASSLFTKDQQSIFEWTGARGSDCGIVNVNIGPSGAEIGGAFGGEKETGGGRESGSDSWKQYMRRSTCTINYSSHLPLAQGVSFEIDHPAP